MSKAWAAGSTRRWRRTRALVLARDGYTCRLRLPGCTGKADCVHHVHGKAITGDDPRYLVASCQACNLAIGEPVLDPTPKAVTQW